MKRSEIIVLHRALCKADICAMSGQDQFAVLDAINATAGVVEEFEREQRTAAERLQPEGFEQRRRDCHQAAELLQQAEATEQELARARRRIDGFNIEAETYTRTVQEYMAARIEAEQPCDVPQLSPKALATLVQQKELSTVEKAVVVRALSQPRRGRRVKSPRPVA